MPIAYYSQPAESSYWNDIWQAESLPELLGVALRDPLTHHILRYVSNDGIVLEAGCGLGQYVALLRDRGFRAWGGDYSLETLKSHRRERPDSPLVGLDLNHMPVCNATLDALVSLGVIEHLHDGPQTMLAEFHRTLAPGGTLLLSVPWMNGYRSLGRVRIERHQAKLQASGAEFYQYAFARNELRCLLESSGFHVRASHPYSPAKGMRECGLLRRLLPTTRRSSQGQAREPTSVGEDRPVRGLRRLLYWPPVLHFFAHMILVVAQKPEG
jgi:SAM-dependent methyltransferase